LWEQPDFKTQKDYGLFITYPLRPRDTLEKIDTEFLFQQKEWDSVHSGKEYVCYPFLPSFFDVLI
jgi:hypothetical protein